MTRVMTEKGVKLYQIWRSSLGQRTVHGPVQDNTRIQA